MQVLQSAGVRAFMSQEISASVNFVFIMRVFFDLLNYFPKERIPMIPEKVKFRNGLATEGTETTEI